MDKTQSSQSLRLATDTTETADAKDVLNEAALAGHDDDAHGGGAKPLRAVLAERAPLPAVVFDQVNKIFTLRHTRSIKEYVVWALKGRKGDLGEPFKALDDVSFIINEGEAVALIGFNGSGKSTTLKLVSGVMQPDSGLVRTRGIVAGLIEVGAGFHPDLTGRENVFLNGAILGMTKCEIEAKYDDIVAFSEIERFMDTEVKFYSSGMFLRLAFAVAIHSNPDVFLIDEILAVGDEPFQAKCLGRIRELHDEGQTLVIVSHALDQLESICDRGIVMRSGRAVFDGPIVDAVAYLRASEG